MQIDKIKGPLIHKHKAADIPGLAVTYTNAEPMPETVHGLEAGSTFDKVPLTDMFTGLLYPYQYPALSGFGITAQSQLVEVGINLDGDKSFTWAVSHAGNVKPNTGIIREMLGNTVVTSLIDLLTPPEVVSMSIPNIAPISKSYRIEGQNMKDQTFVSNAFGLKSVFPMFIGSVDAVNPTESQVKAMTKRVLEKGNQAFIYTINSKCPCFAWPIIYNATLSSVKDTSQFEIISGFLYTTAYFTINGVSQQYAIATLSAPTSQTNFTITFIF